MINLKKNISFCILLTFLISFALLYWYMIPERIIIQHSQTPTINNIAKTQTSINILAANDLLTRSTSSISATWTPLPTYAPSEAQKLVLGLYENNPCKLPCWWNISPGETNWNDAWRFLSRFSTNRNPQEMFLSESKDLPSYIYFQVLLDVPKVLYENDYLNLNNLWFVIKADTSIVEYININTGNVEPYTISEILDNYGKPQEIYIEISESQVHKYNGITIFMYYPQHGFISSHFTTVLPEEFNNNSKVVACFQKVANLYLWNQDENIGFIERLKIAGYEDLGLKELRLINQASNFSVETFYNSFVSKAKQPCIEFIY